MSMQVVYNVLTFAVCQYYKAATWAYYTLAERPFRRYEAWVLRRHSK